MRPTTMRDLAVFSILGMLAAASAGSQQQPARPLEYVRIYHDSAGDSHFSVEKLELSPASFSPALPPVSASAPVAGSGLIVLSAPGGGQAEWHTVPRRQINIMLSGTVQIEVSDGDIRRFGPGSYILGEDTEGKGHRTTVVGSSDAYFAVFTLDQQGSERP